MPIDGLGVFGEIGMLVGWNCAEESVFQAAIINDEHFDVIAIEADIIDILLQKYPEIPSYY